MQEPFFFWTFGVQEPDCFGAIQVLTGDTYLFVPNLPKEHLVWIGEYPTIEKFRSKYQIKEVYYTYKEREKKKKKIIDISDLD
ncbi:hypothetical protein PGB90_000764 [Kerria lacca]